MSSKTKIIVLHMKEIIYTAIFAALGILLIILLVVMFRPGGKKHGRQRERCGGYAKRPLNQWPRLAARRKKARRNLPGQNQRPSALC